MNSHAQTIRKATRQRTLDGRVTQPTPTMPPVIVCVVDTGTPSALARNSMPAAPVSAQKPPNGFSFVSRMPIVFTMRQPPDSVPRPIASWHDRITHIGRGDFSVR